jgi:sarcosine oxidase
MADGAARRADTLVVGAGVVGLAAACTLAERGVDVRCLERAEPGAGQSAGLTRVFRHVHDDERLVRLARESRAGWAEWEARAGQRLVGDEGALLAGIDLAEDASRLAAAGVEGRLVDRVEQAKRLPILDPPAEQALLDPAGGAIRARRTVAALAAWLGPRLVRAEVLGLHPDRDGVVVHTTEGLWRAERCLVCAGVGTQRLAAALGIELPVATACHARATHRVRPRHERERLACWLDRLGAWGDLAYGSPVGGSGRYAVGVQGPGGDAPVPDGGALSAHVDLRPAIERIRRYVKRALPGLEPEPVSIRLCVTTTLSFGRDAFAAWTVGPVTLFAGNNLFKHAPALGSLLADAVVEGRLPAELEPTSALSAR